MRLCKLSRIRPTHAAHPLNAFVFIYVLPRCPDL